jgi:hypothetical protein
MTGLGRPVVCGVDDGPSSRGAAWMDRAHRLPLERPMALLHAVPTDGHRCL